MRPGGPGRGLKVPGWQDEETEMLAELKQPPEVPLGLRMAARRLVRAGWAKAEVRHALVTQREMEAALTELAEIADRCSREDRAWQRRR